jgi:hypothetical protein
MYTRRNLVGYTSHSILRPKTVRKLQWDRHVARRGKIGLHREFWGGLPNVHCEDREGNKRISLIGI